MSVDFASQVALGLAEGRALAESLMTDTCRITKPGDGPRVYDPETMQYTDPARVTVYEGKCRVQIRGERSSGAEQEAGGRMVGTQQPELQLPVDGTEDVAPDHIVEMLTAVHDSSLVGRKFTIDGRHEKSQATMRRLRVIEVTS